MGDLKGFENVVFKKDTAEKTLFYPWSVFGKGFILEADNTYQTICQFFKKVGFIAIAICIIAAVILEMVILPRFQIVLYIVLPLIVISFFASWYYLFVKKITKNLATTNEQIKRTDIYDEMAKSYSVPALILIELFFFVFFTIAVWFLLIGEYIITASLATVLLGITCVLIKNVIAKKIQQLK